MDSEESEVGTLLQKKKKDNAARQKRFRDRKRRRSLGEDNEEDGDSYHSVDPNIHFLGDKMDNLVDKIGNKEPPTVRDRTLLPLRDQILDIRKEKATEVKLRTLEILIKDADERIKSIAQDKLLQMVEDADSVIHGI